VHAPTEEKNDNSMDIFYEELEKVFNFPKYHMEILLRYFNAKMERQDIFKPTSGNDSLHQDSKGNGVGIINSST
jgi:hypothetical protein